MSAEKTEELKNKFVGSTDVILQEASAIVNALNKAHQSFPKELLVDLSECFVKIIKSVNEILKVEPEHTGFLRISNIAEICKFVGFKVANGKKEEAIPIFTGLCVDSLAAFTVLIKTINNKEKNDNIAKNYLSFFEERLSSVKGRIDTLLPLVSGKASSSVKKTSLYKKTKEVEDEDREKEALKLDKSIENYLDELKNSSGANGG